MDGSAERHRYSHTQQGPLCLVLYGSALACIAVGVLTGERLGVLIAGGVGLLLASLGLAFHHLTVEDLGPELSVRFGPLPLFGRTVRYADIDRVDQGRTLILDGWGIHWSVRGGWVWNLWGRDCVVVRFQSGGTLRIGTDDAENLAHYLKGKVHA
jgi:hypothetical protein